MPFWSKNGQRLVRVTSTALAVVLVLVLPLAPCCEVFAALVVADMPKKNTDTSPVHHNDGHVSPSGEHCAPWLEQTFIVPGSDAVLPSSGPSGIDTTLSYKQPSVQFPRIAGLVPHARPQPSARALYRLTSRLLL